jgi:spore coat polysaccharide biosynthesis predicted glycosyltransferase SpsG
LVDKKSSLAQEVIASKNYEVHIQTEESLTDDIHKYAPHVIINDILDTDTTYMSALKQRYSKVINFEDLGEGSKLADLVINALYPDKFAGENHFFGHRYFISRDEFRLSPFKTIQNQVKTVLLTFGGTDPCNLTYKVLSSITDFCILNDISIKVVTGPGYTNYKSLAKFTSVQILKNISNISDFMSEADIIFSSAGRTVYEIACIGTPAVILAQNEREMSHFFAAPENGFIKPGLGNDISQDEILRIFKNLVEDFELRKEMNRLMLEKDIRSGKKTLMKLLKDAIIQ